MHSDEFQQALGMALKSLAVRDRFSGEIRTRLASYNPETVQQVIAHLESKGILDDLRTAQRLLETLQGKRGMGTERLREELTRRGAPDGVVTQCLTGAEDNELDKALDALAAKFAPDVPRAKAGRFLFGRGFGEETIEAALDRFLQT